MAARPEVAVSTQSIATYQDFLSALLSDRERFFEDVVADTGLRAKLRYAALTIVGLAGFFGFVAGAYSGPAQALSAGIKLPFLFFATFAVCFPAFFVVQVLVGSRLRLLQVVVLVFGALALTSVLLAAFVPITLFFLVTGANYYFQHLLNIAIAGVAGLLGMYALHEGLSVVCEKRGVYPRKALTIMRNPLHRPAGRTRCPGFAPCRSPRATPSPTRPAGADTHDTRRSQPRQRDPHDRRGRGVLTPHAADHLPVGAGETDSSSEAGKGMALSEEHRRSLVG